MREKCFEATTEALPDVIAFLEEALEELDCPMKTVLRLSVAIEEVFVNVAHYAYGEGTGEVTLSVAPDGEGSVILELSDRGIPFDPTQKEDPDVSLSALEREIGGLGIFITKKTMDHISWRREDGKNVLTMVKGLGE